MPIKLLKILALVLIISACRSTKEMPADAPPEMRLKEFLEAAAGAENDYQSLHLRASGNFKDKDTDQSFRLEVRILKDSAVWIDIADPYLGIKVARALVLKDSVAFINRMNNEYMTGNITKLQEEFKIPLGFGDLQNILSGNAIFELSREFGLYYRPGLYLLSDFNPDEQDDPRHFAGKEVFRQMSFDSEKMKPVLQLQNEPAMGRNYTVEYHNFSPQDGMLYPDEIEINYLYGTEGRLELKIQSVQKNEAGLNLPFNIPFGYAPMR